MDKDSPLPSPQEKLLERARQLPTLAGVYLMREKPKKSDQEAGDSKENEKGKIIYIGKAANLRSRVTSYFLPSQREAKTLLLVKRVASIEFVTTENEYDALILENNLIKEYTPRYNVNLKDGKTYPVIRLTKERYPRLFRTRSIQQDGSHYFGPYPNIKELDVLLSVIDKVFLLRKCRETPLKRREKPCLYYHINQCSAPCCGRISEEKYREMVNSVKRLLRGDRSSVIRELQKMIEIESVALRFEKAAVLRDSLLALQNLQESSILVDFNEQQRDYLAGVFDTTRGNRWVFSFIKMRGGQVIDRELFQSNSLAGPERTFENFIIQYYNETKNSEGNRRPREVPTTLFNDHALSSLLGEYFQNIHNRRTKIEIPQSKRDRAIFNMAKESALQELARVSLQGDQEPALRLLQQLLKIKKFPAIIEGFDISHMGGTHTVASLIRFVNGQPDRRNYRHLAMKTVLKGEIDDYQSMREALARRYTRLLNENEELPDLILVDGGQGQVNAGYEILESLELEKKIALIGLAKRKELIVFPGEREDLDLPEGDPGLKILQYIRDECHRFANRYLSAKRRGEVDFNLLQNVPGIGKKRSEKLLALYPSLDEIQKSDAQSLSTKTGFSEELSESVVHYLKHRR